MNIGMKIKERRKEMDLSAEHLAECIGVSPATIYRYENGDIEKLPVSVLDPIAKILNTTPAYLMGWQDLPPEAYPYNPTHRIPILGYISAGLPLYAEEHIEGYTYTDLNGGNEYFALRVKGDSMNAVRIYENDVLIVKKQPIVENGEIAIVMVDNENATVKRFYKNGNTITLTPQSTNPEHFPQVYDTKKTDIQIIGKVVKNEIVF